MSLVPLISLVVEAVLPSLLGSKSVSPLFVESLIQFILVLFRKVLGKGVFVVLVLVGVAHQSLQFFNNSVLFNHILAVRRLLQLMLG